MNEIETANRRHVAGDRIHLNGRTMKLRKITSLTALLSFGLMLLTSIVLYIAPQGRVAYWSDWRLLGLSKEQWGDVHINLGLLFLISLSLHVYYNWKAIVSYLKNRAKVVTVFTREFNVALLVTLVFIGGTLAALPPFSLIQSLNVGLKDRAAAVYGEPPYGHAELSSLKTFAAKMGWNLNQALLRLERAGYPVSDVHLTLKTVARMHGVSPQTLYGAMLPPPPAAPKPSSLPESPPPGTGTRTVTELARQHGFDPAAVIADLKAGGLKADAAMSLREIAQQNDTSPLEIYVRIRKAARHQPCPP